MDNFHNLNASAFCWTFLTFRPLPFNQVVRGKVWLKVWLSVDLLSPSYFLGKDYIWFKFWTFSNVSSFDQEVRAWIYILEFFELLIPWTFSTLGLRVECYWNPVLLALQLNLSTRGWEVIFYSITAKFRTSEPFPYWLGALRAIFSLNHRSSWFFHNSTMWVRVRLQIWIESWKILTFWAFRSCDLGDQGWYWTIFLDLFDLSARQVRWHIWLKIW